MSQLTDGSGDAGKNIDAMEMIADEDDEISEAHLLEIDEQLAAEKSGTGYTYNCKDSDHHSKKKESKITRKGHSDNEENASIRRDSSVVDVDDSQTESSQGSIHDEELVTSKRRTIADEEEV